MRFFLPGEGKEKDLQANLDECLQSSPEDGADPAAADGTTFHNITLLGSETISRPKDEASIQRQIARMNAGANEVLPTLSVFSPYVNSHLANTLNGTVACSPLTRPGR